VITGGTQYSGGASLVLGPINISAVAVQNGDEISEPAFGQFAFPKENR
jgi:hypothetical protein